MSAYNIDFSEPLKAGFTIASGGTNGPGHASSDSSLRLYGRGALEWGEAVDEDLLRLAENFASASPPSSAIPGQFWVETQFYYRDTTAVGGIQYGWYRFIPATTTPVVAAHWEQIGVAGFVPATIPVSPVEGQSYYFDGMLHGYYSLGKYEPLGWVTRSFSTGVGTPTTQRPAQFLRIRDNNDTGLWVTPSAVLSSDTAPDANTRARGILWFDTTDGHLKIWSGTSWQDILGPTAGSSMQANGPVDMNGSKITSLGTPTSGSDAANKAYVDSTAGNYVLKTGDTMTGSLVISSGSLTVPGSSVLGTVSVAGILTMNNTTITGVASPSAGTDATNKTYVDGAISAAVSNYLPLSGGAITGNLTISGTTSTANMTVSSLTTTNTLSVAGGSTIGGTLNMTGHLIQNVAPPVSGTDGVNKNYVDTNGGVPPGAILAFAIQTVPAGWLRCNGQLVGTATYPSLFAVLGYSYGGGGAIFGVPSMAGLFVRDHDSGGTVDGPPVRAFGSVQQDCIQDIIGYWGVDDREINTGVGAVRVNGTTTSNAISAGAPVVDTTASGGDGQTHYAKFDASLVARTSNQTRPKNIAFAYCIKT